MKLSQRVVGALLLRQPTLLVELLATGCGYIYLRKNYIRAACVLSFWDNATDLQSGWVCVVRVLQRIIDQAEVSCGYERKGEVVILDETA